jgi:hypothetical protein
MLYIEDVFELIAEKLLSKDKKNFDGLLSDDWSIKFVCSVNEQITNDHPLSTEQAKVVVRMIQDVHGFLADYGDADLTEMQKLLSHPRFKHEPYQSTYIPKEVRHIGSNLLAFRFKYQPAIIKDIHSISKISHYGSKPYFDYNLKLWIVPVISTNFRRVKEVINDHRFGTNDATDLWLTKAKNSYDAPSIIFIEDDLCVATVCANEMLAFWMVNSVGAEPV